MVIINQNFEYAGGTISAGSNIEGVLPERAVQELISKGIAYRIVKAPNGNKKPVAAAAAPKTSRTRRKGGAKQ